MTEEASIERRRPLVACEALYVSARKIFGGPKKIFTREFGDEVPYTKSRRGASISPYYTKFYSTLARDYAHSC